MVALMVSSWAENSAEVMVLSRVVYWAERMAEDLDDSKASLSADL